MFHYTCFLARPPIFYYSHIFHVFIVAVWGRRMLARTVGTRPGSVQMGSFPPPPVVAVTSQSASQAASIATHSLANRSHSTSHSHSQSCSLTANLTASSPTSQWTSHSFRLWLRCQTLTDRAGQAKFDGPRCQPEDSGLCGAVTDSMHSSGFQPTIKWLGPQLCLTTR